MMLKKILKSIIRSTPIVNKKKNIIIDLHRFNFMRFNYIGANVNISEDFNVFNSKNIIIEDNVFIGKQAYIDAIGDVRICSGTMIGPRVTIISANHYYNGFDLKAVPYDNRYIVKNIIIEENVWIGANVSILPGVTIGEGSIIGMSSVIIKDVPKYAIVAGNPARVIGYRDKDVYIKLKENQKIFSKVYDYNDFEYIGR